jgi:hypothetical protein
MAFPSNLIDRILPFGHNRPDEFQQPAARRTRQPASVKVLKKTP